MKKLFTGILASTMILSSLSMVAVASPVEEPLQAYTQTLSATSGQCGENAYWHLNESTGHLTVTGTGSIGGIHYNDGTRTIYSINMSEISVPVKTIAISSGITELDQVTFSYPFERQSELEKVYIPPSVTKINSHAFSRRNPDTYSTTDRHIVHEFTIYGESGSTAEQFSKMNSYIVSEFINYSCEFYFEAVTSAPSWASTGITIPDVTPEQNYPEWVVEYADFISGTIMPDFSSENYGSVCNRALIAQCLFNMAGDGGTYTSKFDDAGSEDSAIGWCDANNVMNGTGDNWFDAAENVTREQLSLILRQLANVQGKDISYEVASLGDFPDGTSGNDWAMAGLAWAVENNLMNGDTEGNLNPLGYVSRVEVAVMLKAFGNI